MFDESYINLSGAIIKRARLDYFEAYYHYLKGDKDYKRKGGSGTSSINTEGELKRLKYFFQGVWFMQLSMGNVDPDYIMEREQKEAKFMVEVEKAIAQMDTDKINEVMKLCKKEIKKRQQRKYKEEESE